MLFQYTSISALAAITFLTQASTSVAGHARSRGHKHGARMAPFSDTNAGAIGRRAAAGMTEIPTGQLVMLQSEITTFQGWMGSYIDSAKSMDQLAALAQLKQEFEAFDEWMTAFLADVMGTGPSTLPAVSSAVPVTTAPASSVVAALTTKSEASVIAALSSSLPLPKISSSPAFTSSTAAEAGSSPSSALIGNSSVPTAVGPASSASASSVVAPELLVPSHTSHSTSSVYTPPIVPASSTPISSSVPVAPASTSAASVPAPSTPGGSSGSFNAGSSSNLAVYYGQSGATGQVTLAQMCQDSNVDIVILAFLTTFFGPGGYPTLNLGAACSGSSAAQTAKGATGLLSCPKVAQDIATCQGLGKKVLLSLGGAEATTAFSSTSQAGTFATLLWNLFGAGTAESSDMKPFGKVTVDGFDLDNEDHSTSFYSDFVSSLRSTMNSDASKKYYISAAPQCPRPDASIPLDAMQSMDFVFVQFYNNGQCDVGQSGFVDSLKAWSGDLSAKGAGPKLYIGAPGCPACAGAGYVDSATMGTVIASAKSAGVSNLGGVMLWDGPEAKGNTAGGKDYLQVVKSALA